MIDNRSYRGGQDEIVHLEVDLRKVTAWAEAHQRRWAFTLSNAGSRFFEDRKDLTALTELDWDAIGATQWQDCKGPKQAEFLVEHSMPWDLVERVGTQGAGIRRRVGDILSQHGRHTRVDVIPSWYY